MTKQYSGILFIGDPHVTCISPKRRVEEEFLDVSLDKLNQSIKIADDNNLFPLCLGDLVNKPIESEVTVPLIKALRGRRLLMPTGNHDVNVRRIFNNFQSDNSLPFNESSTIIPIDNSTTVSILEASGCIDIVNKKEERQVLLENGTLVRLLIVPYGIAIPEAFPDYVGDHEGDIINIMITHHDINFGVGIQYPGSQKIFPIDNCDMVVNGHIHDYKPVQEVGDTKWFNPGNILRTSKTVMHNEPAVYSISDKSLSITKHKLKYKDPDECFIKDFQLIRDGVDDNILSNFNSEFVESLRGTLDDDKTDDGSGVEEIIMEHFSENAIDVEAQDKVFDLLHKAIEESEKENS